MLTNSAGMTLYTFDKDSGGKTPLQLRQEVTATRKMVADTQNQALAAHGHDARVDPPQEGATDPQRATRPSTTGRTGPH